MNSGWLIAAVIASVIAGGVGGFVAVEYVVGEKDAPREVTAATSEEETNYDAEADIQAQNDLISSLRKDISNLQIRVEKAENKKEDNSALIAEIDTLNARIAELEKKKNVVATNEGGEGVVAGTDPASDEFKDAVAQAIEEKEAADRAEWRARQEERMKERMAEDKTRVVATLTDKLALNAAQQTNIEVIYDDYNTKRTEMMDRGRKAMEAGETFDWRAERQKIEDETVQAVKDELTLTQVSTFTELLGDDELDDVGEERREGRRGFGGRGR